MAKLESNVTIKGISKTDAKKSTGKKKAGAALTLLGLTGFLTISYMSDNAIMEHLAISGFIISCIAIIKLMESN